MFGLALGIIGVIIIFRYGPPQPDLSEGIPLGIEGPAVAAHDANIAALRHTYSVWSHIGLGFILAGFVAQLVAEIRSDEKTYRNAPKV